MNFLTYILKITFPISFGKFNLLNISLNIFINLNKFGVKKIIKPLSFRELRQSPKKLYGVGICSNTSVDTIKSIFD